MTLLMPEPTTTPSPEAGDPFDLDLEVSVDLGADRMPAACGTGDGCAPSCASSCASAV